MASLAQSFSEDGLSGDSSSHTIGAAAMLLALQQSQPIMMNNGKGAFRHTPKKPGQDRDAGLSSDDDDSPLSQPSGELAAKRAHLAVSSDGSDEEGDSTGVFAAATEFRGASYNLQNWEPVVIQSSVGDNARICIGHSGAVDGKKIHRCAECTKAFPSVSKVRHVAINHHHSLTTAHEPSVYSLCVTPACTLRTSRSPALRA